MSLECIASQTRAIIECELAKRCIKADREEDGFSEEQIKVHVSRHMLHPNVTLSLMLRNLIELNDKLRQGVYKVDEVTKEAVLDTTELKNYISVL